MSSGRSLYYRVRKIAKVHTCCPVELIEGCSKPKVIGHLHLSRWVHGVRHTVRKSTLKVVVGKEWFFQNMNDEEREIYTEQVIKRLVTGERK